jgi:hypothetical protein
MAELEPSKLVTRVRFPSPAPPTSQVAGSPPTRPLPYRRRVTWPALGSRWSSRRVASPGPRRRGRRPDGNCARRAGGWCGSGVGSSADKDKQSTFRVDAVTTEQNLLDLGAPGTSLGDQIVFTTQLLKGRIRGRTPGRFHALAMVAGSEPPRTDERSERDLKPPPPAERAPVHSIVQRWPSRTDRQWPGTGRRAALAVGAAPTGRHSRQAPPRAIGGHDDHNQERNVSYPLASRNTWPGRRRAASRRICEIM